jgi:hypothetical protein
MSEQPNADRIVVWQCFPENGNVLYYTQQDWDDCAKAPDGTVPDFVRVVPLYAHSIPDPVMLKAVEGLVDAYRDAVIVEDRYGSIQHWRAEKHLKEARAALIAKITPFLTRSAGPVDAGEVEDLRKYAHDLQIALTGLAGGGSENFIRKGEDFRADIPFCVNKVRRRFDEDAERFKAERRARIAEREARTKQPAAAPQTEAVERQRVPEITLEEWWQDHLDKNDRNSPEEYPEMVLVTFDELREVAALSTSPAVADGGWERCPNCKQWHGHSKGCRYGFVPPQQPATPGQDGEGR